MNSLIKFVSRFDKPTAYSDGNELAMRCPFHQGRSKNLWLSVPKMVFICYRCGQKGTLRKLLHRIREVRPGLFADIPEELLTGFLENKPVAIRKLAAVDKDPTEIELPKEFQPLWGQQLLSPMGQRAYEYLKKRGLDEDTIEVYRIGYCEFGDYAYRVIVPTYEGGHLVYWLARDFTNKMDLKVKNPPKAAIKTGAKQCVFNLNVADAFRHLVINEGVFDAIATGINAVALFGKTASATQIQKIRAKKFETITVMLDADAPTEGYKLAVALTRSLPSKDRPTVKLATLPEGDPNSVPPEVVKQALKDAVVVKEL